MIDDRLLNGYDKEIKRDLIEIEVEKQKFINSIKNGLGSQINDFDTYVKPEPTLFQRFKMKVNKIFKAI